MEATQLIPIRFPENDVVFGMDMQFWQNIPTDVDFYAVYCHGDRIVFRGDGYGSPKKYGNGSISVYYNRLPETVKETVYSLFKEEIEQHRFKKECEELEERFKELLKTNFTEAKAMLNCLVAVKLNP